ASPYHRQAKLGIHMIVDHGQILFGLVTGRRQFEIDRGSPNSRSENAPEKQDRSGATRCWIYDRKVLVVLEYLLSRRLKAQGVGGGGGGPGVGSGFAATASASALESDASLSITAWIRAGSPFAATNSS